MLARAGWRVLLFEKARFPREHIGESLLPATLPILQDLGALEAVQRAGFTHKAGATMRWGSSSEPWSWYFHETNATWPHSYQVWRPQFDQILLDNAAANGVDVRQEHRVLGVCRHDGRVTGVRFVDDTGAELEASCRFVVDASGQAGLIGRDLGLRTPDESFRNLAVYGYFANARRLPEPDSGNIFIESYPDGWVWAIPLHTGVMSVGVVVDSALGQAGIREHGPEGFLHAQLATAPSTSDMLREARQESTTYVIRDWSYMSSRLAGDGWVLVGDAACFIDPLFSSGVHLAMSSAVLASAHVTTTLRRPEMEQATGAVFEELYRQQYHHFREMARLFYGTNRTEDSYYWEARRILGDEASSPREAFIRAVAGQSPKGYERAVLGHGELPDSFVASVRSVEDERARRRMQVEAAMTGPDPAARPILAAVPELAPDAELQRKPVLGEGEFEWGYALVRPGQADVPLSGLIAVALSLVDGQRTVGQIAEEVAKRAGTPQAASPVVSAFGILYTDGALANLRGV
jgi:flavin-dependent dehydrogenase